MGLAPDSVGVRDDFEDLGGTSLDAASLIAEIERHFRVRLHSEVLAANPTIERLAAYIDRHGAALESSRRPRFAG
ncbi:MAG TPA: acyl carrier protein [Bryobacteraceae bacterium]|nr:acyl carrier protein [Bryobacteraceae bacterium]HPQ15232.1 acyl carrier protein [Bryobacteraceae bacterium]HPU73772.1 acyl carrier protein [Bryobacteraceae bacterium]